MASTDDPRAAPELFELVFFFAEALFCFLFDCWDGAVERCAERETPEVRLAVEEGGGVTFLGTAVKVFRSKSTDTPAGAVTGAPLNMLFMDEVFSIAVVFIDTVLVEAEPVEPDEWLEACC